jgi:predicted hydrocarbon binding protein
MISHLPKNERFSFNLFMPKKFSKVKDMKKMLLKMGFLSEKGGGSIIATGDGIFKFLEEMSKSDEYYFRVSEYYECWEFRNVGATMATFLPPTIAGLCKGLEKERRDWNVIETKCIGLGHSCCEFKLIPGEISELESSQEKDVSLVEKINERMMESLIEFLLHKKPLVNRPHLGSQMHLQGASSLMGISATGGERYRTACRIGGVKIGKRIGESLKDAGIEDNESIKYVSDFLKHCKVGDVTIGNTIKIRENCESIWTRCYTTTWEEPSCFFTGGFFNGFFSAIKNKNVRETKCIAMGDPYCEWEFR